MEFTVDLAILAQVLSIVVAIFAIAAFWWSRRENIVSEGKMTQKMENLFGRVETQDREIQHLKDRAGCTDVDLARIYAKLESISDSLQEIKLRIDDIAPPTPRTAHE